MNETNERSVGSAGSRPVSGGPITLRLSNEEQQEMLSRLSGRQSGTLVPLDLPQPTLTDAEREAVRYFAHIRPHIAGMTQLHAATLRTLLERMK